MIDRIRKIREEGDISHNEMLFVRQSGLLILMMLIAGVLVWQFLPPAMSSVCMINDGAFRNYMAGGDIRGSGCILGGRCSDESESQLCVLLGNGNFLMVSLLVLIPGLMAVLLIVEPKIFGVYVIPFYYELTFKEHPEELKPYKPMHFALLFTIGFCAFLYLAMNSFSDALNASCENALLCDGNGWLEKCSCKMKWMDPITLVTDCSCDFDYDNVDFGELVPVK